MKKNLMEATDFLDNALKIAEKVCKTDLCPIQFKNKPNEALAAMLYGKELNFGPMQSLNCINIINGKFRLLVNFFTHIESWLVPQNKTEGRHGWCCAEG